MAAQASPDARAGPDPGERSRMSEPQGVPASSGLPDVVAATGLRALGDTEFRLFRELVFRKSGITLNDSKKQLVASRLARRLRALGLTAYRDYYEHVIHRDPDGEELREMLNAITTNKTDFFREKHHFEFMRTTFFPQCVERARQTGQNRLRIWSAGCSTGEEPYTLAITLLTHFPAPPGQWTFELIATDLDTNVLERARQGIYPEETVAPVPPDLVQRFFRRGTGANEGKVRVSSALSEMITFRQLNFVEQPWPVQGPFDLILCRNVMIYFNQETQRQLVDGFAGLLREDGYLFIGHSETLNGTNHLFEPLRGTMYRRRRSGEAESGGAPPRAGAAGAAPPPDTASPERPSLAPRPGAAGGPARLPGSAAAPPETAAPEGAGRRPAEADGRSLGRINVIIGGVRASREPVLLRTVLGSCVCACLFDPVAKVGGINHFMLPDGLEDQNMPTRFGVNAMEVLINDLLKLGADRRRLQAKVFGAAHVLSDMGLSPDVPRKNARFVKEFLENENIPIASSRLGGSAPVEVIFTSDTGKAMVRALGDAVARDLAREESRHDLEIKRNLVRPQDGSVELF
jgi:chemotaxis protein methyltransferase CheR